MANKRLKDALALQRLAADERRDRLAKKDMSGIGARIRVSGIMFSKKVVLVEENLCLSYNEYTFREENAHTNSQDAHII